MKKILLFTAFAIFAFVNSHAQGEFRIGFKAGVNVASIGGDDTFGIGSFGSRTGFHVGALVEIPINEKFSVQPELLYSAKGSNYDFSSGDTDIKLDYIDVPILAKYHIIQGLSAELGPVIGVLVKADADNGDETEDIKEFYKSTDIGIGIGASYRLPMGVFFSLRYNKGLTDINDNPDTNAKNQNNVFQVSAGYSF
ncbi:MULTISPECIES: porin family protein [Aequorivita]|uniref:PorT family protein n=1 Tax=Aequorivita iocasae TaxID=2803865 RepID=A0ABX7DQ14_9FLAO|nr:MULTISPECIES: porin family protein [Aequorivita]QQX76083.1 PorT family protein [Aequorivita iocasae]UCA55543.1 PorT family protein [Aequorivita sp. F7]